jgi:hypothetical protein
MKLVAALAAIPLAAPSAWYVPTGSSRRSLSLYVAMPSEPVVARPVTTAPFDLVMVKVTLALATGLPPERTVALAKTESPRE